MLEEKLIRIAKSPLGVSIAKKYENKVKISGMIVNEPKFLKNSKTGKESCSVIIHQVSETPYGQILDKSFNFITYVPKEIEKLREVKTCCFVSALANLEWFPRMKQYTIQVHELELDCFMNEPLEPMYNS